MHSPTKTRQSGCLDIPSHFVTAANTYNTTRAAASLLRWYSVPHSRAEKGCAFIPARRTGSAYETVEPETTLPLTWTSRNPVAEALEDSIRGGMSHRNSQRRKPYRLICRGPWTTGGMFQPSWCLKQKCTMDGKVLLLFPVLVNAFCPEAPFTDIHQGNHNS